MAEIRENRQHPRQKSITEFLRIERLFLKAAELSPEFRGQWLHQLAETEEATVVDQVRRMLRADADAGRRLESSIEKAAAHMAESTSVRELLRQNASAVTGTPLAGDHLGAYRLVRELGQGGMSIVFLATRSDDEFEQTVALKVLRHGPVNAELSRRLLVERQILARLSHPNIARLLDGGTTEDGLPYFVMEVIVGEPIDQFCDHRCLNLSRRIKLFQKICQAVQFAHRNLVIHRDIKPSNILVTEVESGQGGEPKLLDFGIAKLLDPASPSDVTNSPYRVGTPGYSSPEQIRNLPITTASDVYSLGVLLYLLLSGGRPYLLSDSASIRQVEEAILEQTPRLPSAVAHQLGDDNAAKRGARPDLLSRQLAGDLDNIIMMALRKEPERRYGSVEVLAEDLERYLAGLPVRARPNTLSYRARKFLWRNRLLSTAGASLLLMTLLFIITLLRQEARVIRQRDRAEQVSTMLVSLFEVAGPSAERSPDLTARHLLDLGREQLGRLDDQPETQAMLRHTLGTLYEELGFYDQAQELFELAATQREELFGEAHPAVVESLYHLALAYALAGEHGRAEPHFRRTLELRRALLGEDHPDVAVSLNSLALVLHEQGNYEAAAPMYNQALDMSERLNGANHPQTLKTRGNLALLLFDLGHYPKAEVVFRRSLEGRQQLEGQSLMVAGILDGLSQSLAAQAKVEEAEQVAREVLATRQTHLGDDHVLVARSLAHLADVVRLRDPAAARELAEEAFSQRQRWLGDDNAETGESLSILASIQALQGDRAGAAALYRRAITAYVIGLSPSHPMAARPVAELGILLAEDGDCERAVAHLKDALAHLPADDGRTQPAHLALNQCLSLSAQDS